MIDLSIIVPVYNAEKYLTSCVESILLSYSKIENFSIEILFVNDGSKDSSIDILKALEKKHSFIRIIDKKNEGVSVARNIALDSIQGDHVWMIDSDDLIHPDSLQLISEMLKVRDTDIIHFGYSQEVDVGVLKSYNLDDKYLNVDSVDGISFLKSNDGRLYLWTNIYSMSYLTEHNIRFKGELRSLEDSLFNIQAFVKAKKVSFIPQLLYTYCYNPNSISRDHSLDKLIMLKNSTLNVHDELLFILKNIKKLDSDEFKVVKLKLDKSVLGFFYSLIALSYPISIVKDSLESYELKKLYPLKFRTDSFKAELFKRCLNVKWFFLMLCKFKLLLMRYKT